MFVSNCLYQIVCIKLFVSNCLYQIVCIKLFVSNCLYQITQIHKQFGTNYPQNIQFKTRLIQICTNVSNTY